MLSNHSSEFGGLVENQPRRKRPVVSCNECHRRKQKCDRLQPCANCTKRDKMHLCVYTHVQEEPFLDSGGVQDLGRASNFSSWAIDSQSDQPQLRTSSDSHQQSVSNYLGYSGNHTTGTLALMRMAGMPEHIPALSHQETTNQNSVMATRYKSLIRQLPPQRHIEVLLRFFFSEVAWYYDIIDQASITEQLSSWNQVPYSTISQGPFSLPPDARTFPALLFQLLAHALLFLPAKDAHVLNQLKYVPDMAYADLAIEYSDAGSAIASMLGNRNTTLAKVQAGLLRASFQKSTGLVAEAWHTLGGTIRDAQEIGLHCVGSVSLDDALDRSDAISPSNCLRDVGMRTKLWLMLHLWDGHMGVVLGRPMSTKVDFNSLMSLFEDIEGREELTQGHEGGESQRLTPFSFILCGYRTAYRYLQDIHELESSGSSSQDKQQTIERIHAAITDNMRCLPEWARAKNNSNEYCHHPWLPAARETLLTEVHFTLLALHRPFIFSIASSRDKAHKAALQILASQDRLFSMTEPREYLPFNLVFATFDAMVLIATIYILFPNENLEQLDASLRSIEWGLRRLDAMKTCNKMADLAFDVVQALYTKLVDHLHSGGRLHLQVDPDGSSVQQSASITPELFLGASSGELAASQFGVLPQNLAAVPPPQPLHDLVLQTFSGSGELSVEQLSRQPPQNLLDDDEFWRLIGYIPD
ncbi:uncharacterized protein NECHADRAFT_79743 [Fusarium vanettenii 77-13-4]|uniref:Zn(2)-C6 fungal-type domain-containing protein n=1 Tax=Fusarium vanettenii (strain ATCC MYA-4622 / CBS 123669 / FGSC 9596 / NRRL 45880 / 77-13-4) TaxID=660122 RepID=C7Z8C9_FUSV7|nr:uncharacterized protein NECHADRAFT_79743 [Fusarium vanettenii 77-13-4]EEU39848.1 hypothetical protein NECHADRAFT_79743 [Fusarium vanettenii 77-13-4]